MTSINAERLKALLQPKAADEAIKGWMTFVLAQPKGGKTVFAHTASTFCPPPEQWNAEKPVLLQDLAVIQIDPNGVLSANRLGIKAAQVFDWSQKDLHYTEYAALFQGLVQLAPQLREAGIRTLVLDNFSILDKNLKTTIVDVHKDGSMDKPRSYGTLSAEEIRIMDYLKMTGMNVIVLAHLKAFQPFGEAGGNSESAQKMAEAAAKQIEKKEASALAGERTALIPDLVRDDVVRYINSLSDAVVSLKRIRKAVGPGKVETKYVVSLDSSKKVGAGNRWNIAGEQPAYFRPILEKVYGGAK